VHFHMLIPDGVYLMETDPPYLRRVGAPTTVELQALAQRISERIGGHLERKGLLVRNLDSSHLALEPRDTQDALTDLQGHSITYRIALGPHQGRKAFMLQSLPPRGEPLSSDRVAQAAGFSLHAGVAAEADQRDKLERLRRYIARPAVAIERLSLTAQGHIRYALKTPYRDGTTQVIFEPLDFLARLAALVPSPGVNLTRYHGVFAANHRLRARIVPGQRGRDGSGEGQGSAVPKHAAMTWAQRLKRVFGIEIERCEQCGGAVKIIASIEDPQVIGRILGHLGLHGSDAHNRQLPPARAPPIVSIGLFD
jgi:Putative transposase